MKKFKVFLSVLLLSVFSIVGYGEIKASAANIEQVTPNAAFNVSVTSTSCSGGCRVGLKLTATPGANVELIFGIGSVEIKRRMVYNIPASGVVYVSETLPGPGSYSVGAHQRTKGYQFATTSFTLKY
ncbi:hypothetical protein M3685_06050 [Heyndrickxia oleronia]|uniref:hypothetical protein n=1 Tax=Heyndrickxia TaxID=2837504 RepID=UPI001B18E98B|nr:hypothetical protein [Heyndrickxia oleronia]MCM3453497.1 hypothetical protein [Heyndrickxia oleronia]GIN38176.1 hypothetical protein J19TS1_11250 [Heyndrickxia oleronia]